MLCNVLTSVKHMNKLPYFLDYKPRLFFKNFRVAAYIVVRLVCGRFQKTTHYTLHATACLDQHLITHDQLTHSASTITDCLCSRVATPPPPAVSLSLCPCMRPSTARTGRAWENSHLTSRAQHAALAPRWQYWYHDQQSLMCHAALWATHVTQLTVGHTPDVLAWH